MIALFHLLSCCIIATLFYLSVQLILGLRTSSKDTTYDSQNSERRKPAVILVPAHNEAATIKVTLKEMIKELNPEDHILVVADNCTDDTADVCRQFGAEVVERFNDKEKGKGFALQYGVEHIKAQSDEFETIIVMDADCYFRKGSFAVLVNESQSNDCIVQAKYLMLSPNRYNARLNIAEFTWLIKNWIRPKGNRKLGISCQIQGSGMAFPAKVLDSFSLASSSIVEDLELGINLTEARQKIRFCEHSEVFSFFPENDIGLKTQRTRWEHGHLATVIAMPRVMLRGILKGNIELFFKAYDAAIPPLTLWVFVCLIFLTIGGFLALSSLSYVVLPTLFAFLTFLILLVATWMKYGKNILPASQVFDSTKFFAYKPLIFLSFMKKREMNWVKTKRDNE